MLRLFECLPEHLHENDPFFVPPFPGSVAKLFSPKAPFSTYARLIPLLAFRDRKPVGRIAAIVNRTHNTFYSDRTGFFGFFDFINDTKVAAALLTAAKNELLKYGLVTLRGPYNPTIHDECGVLIDGFDSPPMVMMPYNPAYYPKIYAAVGLSTARKLHAYYIRSDVAIPPQIARIVERIKAKNHVVFRNINLKAFDEELKIIQELYNATLKGNWGFIPLSFADLKFAANDLKAIMRPEFVIIAEKDRIPIGFSLLLPNINEFLSAAKRYKGLFRVLTFAWLLKTKFPKEARLAILGVRPEFDGTGIPAVFYYEAIKRGRSTIVGGELSWVEEGNIPIIRAIEKMGGSQSKTYQIFESPI